MSSPFFKKVISLHQILAKTGYRESPPWAWSFIKEWWRGQTRKTTKGEAVPSTLFLMTSSLLCHQITIWED